MFEVTMAAALASAAAAEAAQAAMEVMRLTNTRLPISALRIREQLHFAAIMIQTAFRGYLARKALKALKGLVKLQALVRGYNVRERAKMTLQCMQSMVRVQTQFCDQRSRRLSSSSSASLKEARNSTSRYESISNIYPKMEEEIQIPEACLSCKRRLGFPGGQELPETYNQTNLSTIKTIRIDTSRSRSHNSSPSPSPSKQSNRRNSPSKSIHKSAVHPNYMSDTASAKAKIRTQSVPKTRPMTPEREQNWRTPMRRMSGPDQALHHYNSDIDDSVFVAADYNQTLPRSIHARAWLR